MEFEQRGVRRVYRFENSLQASQLSIDGLQNSLGDAAQQVEIVQRNVQDANRLVLDFHQFVANLSQEISNERVRHGVEQILQHVIQTISLR